MCQQSVLDSREAPRERLLHVDGASTKIESTLGLFFFEHLPLAFWTAMHMNFILFYTSWVFMILFRKYLSHYLWNFKLWKPLAFWLQVTNSGGRPWRQVRQMEVESGVRVLAERPAEDFEPTEEEASPECLAAWSLKNQDWRTLRSKFPQKRWISQNVFDFTVSDICVEHWVW